MRQRPSGQHAGEVMGIDRSFDAAFFKALIAAGLALPDNGNILLSLADEDPSGRIWSPWRRE